MKRNEKIYRCFACLLVTVAMLAWMPDVSAQQFEYPEYPDLPYIAVRSQGNRPVISDFVTAFLNHSKEKKFYDKVCGEWQRYQQKKPLSKNTSIILDTKNGYMRYQIIHPEERDTVVMEMCFWNCADGKHKLVCANTYWVMGGDYGWDDYVGTYFFVYDNKTKKMREIYAEDIGALYDGDGLSVFFLPRKGKNIKVSAAGGGDRWNEVLEWDGYQFSSKKVP